MSYKRKLHENRRSWAFWTPVCGSLLSVHTIDLKVSMSRQLLTMFPIFFGFGASTVLIYNSYTSEIEDLDK